MALTQGSIFGGPGADGMAGRPRLTGRTCETPSLSPLLPNYGTHGVVLHPYLIASLSGVDKNNLSTKSCKGGIGSSLPMVSTR